MQKKSHFKGVGFFQFFHSEWPLCHSIFQSQIAPFSACCRRRHPPQSFYVTHKGQNPQRSKYIIYFGDQLTCPGFLSFCRQLLPYSTCLLLFAPLFHLPTLVRPKIYCIAHKLFSSSDPVNLPSLCPRAICFLWRSIRFSNKGLPAGFLQRSGIYSKVLVKIQK